MDIPAEIINGSSCAALSFLIYKTDAIAEYAKCLRLHRLFDLTAYFCFKIQNPYENYFDFLHYKRHTFFTKLLACPFCFGFWLCAAASQFSFFTLFCYCVYIITYKIMIKL